MRCESTPNVAALLAHAERMVERTEGSDGYLVAWWKGRVAGLKDALGDPFKCADEKP